MLREYREKPFTLRARMFVFSISDLVSRKAAASKGNEIFYSIELNRMAPNPLFIMTLDSIMEFIQEPSVLN